MPWALAAGAVAAPVIGGVIGSMASGDDKDKALAAQQKALQSIIGIHTPDAEELRLQLEKYASAGEIAPQMQTLIQQQPSLMNDVSVDPRLRNAQMQSLQTLQKIGSGELRPEDQAALAQVRQQNEQQQNANRQSILQNMQQRGIGGSGAELAAQLSNSQSSANRAGMQDLDIAGQASQRALQAIYSGGQLGGQLEGQQFGEDSQKASAQDVINRYNAMNAQQNANTNTGLTNQAQAQNLANRQRIMDANTGVGNQQAQYNAQVAQQVFQNQLAKGQAAAGQYGQQANAANANAANTQTMWSGVGQGVGKAAAGVYGAQTKAPAAKPTSSTIGLEKPTDEFDDIYKS